MKYLLVILVLNISASVVRADWEADVRQKFRVFAQAMKESSYGSMFELFTAESSDKYRRLMLELYAAEEKHNPPSTPPDKDGKPMSVKDLRALENAKYWELHIAWFRAIEKDSAAKIKKATGQLGMPAYEIAKIFRDGNRAFVLADRTFNIKSEIKIPYQVIEFILEDGQWKLEVPRDLMWETANDIAKLQKEEPERK